MVKKSAGQGHRGAGMVRLLNLVPQNAKYGVGDGNMQIFDDLHVVGGNHHTDIAERISFCPPWKPVMPAVAAPAWRAKLKSRQYVGRVPAGADGEGDVAGTKQIFELFGENAFVAAHRWPRP